MKIKMFSNIVIIQYLVVLSFSSYGQQLPVGTPVLEEYERLRQLRGNSEIKMSFMVRPFSSSTKWHTNSLYDTSNVLQNNIKAFSLLEYDSTVFMPIHLKQQYNSHHPFGRNDGSMIQAKGYQTQLSFGLYSKIGLLNIQLQPEIVYAQNQNFSTFPTDENDSLSRSYYLFVLNNIDNPEKYGIGSFTKLFLGQSSVRLNYKKLSLGISTENLWWGPGIRNALIMSNNAPGFQHVTFNTTSPVNSPIGSFEWQIISGILKKIRYPSG